jgi:hypothetical protein
VITIIKAYELTGRLGVLVGDFHGRFEGWATADGKRHPVQVAGCELSELAGQVKAR